MSNVDGPKGQGFGVVTTEADARGTAGKGKAKKRQEILRRQLVGRLPSGLEGERLEQWKGWCAELAGCITDDLLTWDEAVRLTPAQSTMLVRERSQGRGSKLKSVLPRVSDGESQGWSSDQAAQRVVADGVLRNQAGEAIGPDEEVPGPAPVARKETVEQTVTTTDGDRWEETGYAGVRRLFVNGRFAGELHGDADWRPQPPHEAWARACIVCVGQGSDGCPGCAGYGIRGHFDGLGAFIPEKRDPPCPIETTTVELGQVSKEEAAKLIGVGGAESNAEDAALDAVEKLLPPDEAGNAMVKGIQSKHLRWLLGRFRSLKSANLALLEQASRNDETRAALLQRAVSAERAGQELLQDREVTQLRVTDDGLSDRESFLRCTYRDLVVHQGEKPQQAAKLALEAWEAIPELLKGGAS